MSQVLSLRLLGPFQVEDPCGLRLPTRKAEALVAFLASPVGRLHHRGELAELLWGRCDEAHARHSLRQALSVLRQMLARADINALVADGDRIGFDPAAVTTDVARLRAVLEDGSLRALSSLVELWGGDLLAGMDIGEEAFEDWLRAERVSLRESTFEGLLRLLEEQARQGSAAAAIRTAGAILRLDPTHEATHRRLMDLYASQNRRNLALKQYRDCAAVLRRELDVAPEPETRRLYEQLLRGQGAATCGPAPADPPAPSSRGPRRKSDRPVVALRRLIPATADAVEAAIADVLNEDLLTAMARDRDMSVVEQLPAAGTESSARTYVIEGTIRRIGTQARVTARLIDPASTACLWSEQSHLAPDDILCLDRSLASRMGATFRREIESTEARKALADPAAAPDAWGCYHLGLREMYRFSMPGLRAARRYFERAIALDPEFAPAHARLAYVFLQLYWYGPNDERTRNLEQGLAAAQQAVGLDPKSARGHFARGRLCALRGEFDLAVRELETAIGLDGSFAQAHFGLGQAYAAAGDPASALAPLDRAIALDPHDPHSWTFYHDRAEASFALGRLAEAEQFSRIAVGMSNASHFAHATLVAITGASCKNEGTAAAVAGLKRIKPDYGLAAATEELSHHANQTFVGEYLAGLARAGLAA